MILVDNIWWPCLILLATDILRAAEGQSPRPPPPPPSGQIPEPYYVQNNDKSYTFGFQAKDHYHHGDATPNNIVKGEFGARNPQTGVVDSVLYTAGPRGFRPRGKNIARKYDLTQGPRASPNDKEDPSYNFGFRTRTYNREEGANRLGDVTGRYSFIDDLGERHNVEYVAGKKTGFHVRTPFPDSNPSSIGPLFYKGPGKPGEKPRGRTSIQRGLDGSYKFISAGPDHRRTESSDAKGHVRGSYTFVDDKGTTHTVHYIAGPETGYRVLKNVKAPHFPSWYPLEPSRPSRPPSIGGPPPVPGPGGFPASPTDFGGEDYGDGDKNIEDIFGGPQEQLSTAASGHAKPSQPTSFGASDEKDESKAPAFDNDFGGSFDEAVGGRPSSTSRPSFGGFNGGGPQQPSFLDEGGLPGGRPGFGGKPSKPSFLGEGEEGSFGAKPGSTKPPFGGDDNISAGFGATGEETGGRPSAPSSDNDFMDDLFKPSGPTGVGPISKPSRPGSRPPTGFGGFDIGRPSSTRPPSFTEDLPKPFGGEGPGDDFELFGSGDKGKPTPGRPSYTGGSKEDMNYGFFDGHKGPTSGPPNRPPTGGGKEEGVFDFFGGTASGGDKGPSSTARPSSGYDFFGEDKAPRPSKRPPAPTGGGKDDFDFFGNDNLGSTERPFRPTPAATKPDDHYSFDGRQPTSRPTYATGDGGEGGTIMGSINVATSHDGKITILTNIGDKHISFPPGVAVRAHVQSIDFLPYGSRVPSPSEQLKQQLRAEATNHIQHTKRETVQLKENDND